MAYRDLWKRDWRQTLRRVWAEMVLDDCFGASAQLAYYFLLGFFPFMIFLVALVAYLPPEIIPGAKIEGRTWVVLTMELLGRFMPQQALELVRSTVEVLDKRNVTILPLSVVGALLVASNGMRAIMVTLNRAYSVREGRALWYRYGLAIVLTVAFSLTVLMAALLLSLSNRVGGWMANHWGAGQATVWWFTSQALGFGTLIFIVEFIYHFAPNVRRPWHWITPGSIVAVLLWYTGSRMFKLYVSNFGQYEVMYAGLGAVVVFLLWLYIAGLAILVGGEINAELERSSGMIAPVAVPAPASVDAAGHDTRVREDLRDPDSAPQAAIISGSAAEGPLPRHGVAADGDPPRGS